MRSSAAPQLPRPRRCAWSSRARLLALGCAVGYFASSAAFAQLQWGTAGAGGTGTWDKTTANWWNGTAQVPWTAGGVAMFGGTAGTVTINGSVEASKVVFTTPGYSISNFSLNGAAGGITLEAQADATIGSTIFAKSGNPGAATKTGAGKLTVTSGFSSFNQITIAEGELEFGGSSSVGSTPILLADVPGVTLTLGVTSFFGGLSGGGVHGGIVRPASAQSRAITVRGLSGTFAGTFSDNGSAILEVDVSSGITETLTGVNTHSGPTVAFGAVVLSGAGRLVNSPTSISGSLKLDNTSVVVSDRLSDTAAVTLSGGELILDGDEVTPITEQAGTLTLTRIGTVTVNQPGSALTEMVFNGIDRTSRGTVAFAGSGATRIENATQASGILGGWATVGNDWARLDGANRVVPFVAYSADIATPTLAEHTRLSSDAVLAGDTTRLSLNLANAGAANAQIDQSGHSLTLETGALLSGGAGSWSLVGGTLSVGAMAGNELIVTTQTDLALASKIEETMPGLAVTKSGAGVLTLSGTNHFTGPLTLQSGVLAISDVASFGQPSALRINGGTFRTLSSMTTALSLDSKTAGIFDTQAGTLTFTGSAAGLVKKTGGGDLIFTSPVSFSSVTMSEGRMVFTTPSSGSTSLLGGELDVTGRLSSLSVPINFTETPVLCLGDNVAATLNTSVFSVSYRLTLEFDLGSTGSDLLTTSSIVNLSGTQPGGIMFRFLDLGGATAGVAYTLYQYPTFTSISASVFAIAPESAAAGWAGTFTASSGQLKITFTSTPEPGAGGLLATAGGLIGMRRRRQSGRPTS